MTADEIRERALSVVKLADTLTYVDRADYDTQLARLIHCAITSAVDAAVAEAADRAMATMERLNTDYRHEIADAIRARGGSK